MANEWKIAVLFRPEMLSRTQAFSLSREAHEVRVNLLLASDLIALALLSRFLVHLLQLILLQKVVIQPRDT